MPAMPRPSFFGPISAPLELHRKLLGRLPAGDGELGGGEDTVALLPILAL